MSRQRPIVETVLAEIEEYLMATATTAGAFGLAAVGDQNLVYELRAGGRDLKGSTIDKIRRHIATTRRSAS